MYGTIALDVHADSAMRGLPANEVAEMTRCRLVHSLHTFDFAGGQRGDAGDHLVRHTDSPQRTVLTHNRLILGLGTRPGMMNRFTRARRKTGRACRRESRRPTG